MKNLIALAAAAALTFGTAFAAPVEFSGSLTGSTERNFRGLALTDDKPGVDADVEATAFDGLVYGGIGASNMDFGVAASQAEVRYKAGVRPSATVLGQDYDFDFGATFRDYYGEPKGPGVPNFDWIEFNALASTQVAGVDTTFGVRYSPDFYAESGEYWRGEVQLSKDVSVAGFDARVFGGAGYSTVDRANVDYTDWNVGVGVPFGGNYEARVVYTGTSGLPAGFDVVSGDRVALQLAAKF